MEARPAIALVQTIAEFPRAVVLLFKLPLYESLVSVLRAQESAPELETSAKRS